MSDSNSTTKTLVARSSTYTENWNAQKEILKAKFPALTDADLQYESGKKNEMMTKIQTKLGRTQKDLDTIIAGQ